MSGFVINLATLGPGRNPLKLEAPAADLDLIAADWPGEVEADLEVDMMGEQVSVRGRIAAVARLECARCLRSFERTIEADFELFADRAGSSRRIESDLERDNYMQFHDGRQLDLRGGARESLLLEWPITPRCREACMGLCPRCGADLNEGPCACPKDIQPSRAAGPD